MKLLKGASRSDISGNVLGWFVLVLATNACATPSSAYDPQNEDHDRAGLVLRAGYSLGRNFSPTEGSVEAAYVSMPRLEAGVAFFQAREGSGLTLGGGFRPILGHSAGTTRELLASAFVTMNFHGVRGNLGALYGFGNGEAGVRTTKLAELEFGFSLPVGDLFPGIGVSALIGEAQDDGFVAMLSVGLAIDWLFLRF